MHKIENSGLIFDMQNCDIVGVNKLLEQIEFVYQKDGVDKYFVITPYSSYLGGDIPVFNRLVFSSEQLPECVLDGTLFVGFNEEVYYHKEPHEILNQIRHIAKIELLDGCSIDIFEGNKKFNLGFVHQDEYANDRFVLDFER